MNYINKKKQNQTSCLSIFSLHETIRHILQIGRLLVKCRFIEFTNIKYGSSFTFFFIYSHVSVEFDFSIFFVGVFLVSVSLHLRLAIIYYI